MTDGWHRPSVGAVTLVDVVADVPHPSWPRSESDATTNSRATRPTRRAHARCPPAEVAPAKPQQGIERSHRWAAACPNYPEAATRRGTNRGSPGDRRNGQARRGACRRVDETACRNQVPRRDGVRTAVPRAAVLSPVACPWAPPARAGCRQHEPAGSASQGNCSRWQPSTQSSISISSARTRPSDISMPPTSTFWPLLNRSQLPSS